MRKWAYGFKIGCSGTWNRANFQIFKGKYSFLEIQVLFFLLSIYTVYLLAILLSTNECTQQ